MALDRREKGESTEDSEALNQILPRFPCKGVRNMGGINEFPLRTWQKPGTGTWRMLPLGRGFGFSNAIPDFGSVLRVRAGAS